MPAPVPIRIRYDAPAALARAAMGAGEGQREAARDARSWDAAMRVAQLNQQARQLAQQERIQQQRLELDYAKLAQQERLQGQRLGFQEQMARRRATPTPGAIQQPAAAGVPINQAKAAYLQSVAPELPPSEAQALGVLAMDPATNLNQMRVATSEALRRTQAQQRRISPQKAAVMEVRGVEDEIKRLQREAADLADKLEEAGFNPEAPPAQFTAPAEITKGWVAGLNLGEDVAPGVEGGPEALQTYTAMTKKLQQVEALKKQREQLLNAGPAQPQGPGTPPQGPGTPSRPTTMRSTPETPPADMEGWSIQRID